jgi:hypothetical protein
MGTMGRRAASKPRANTAAVDPQQDAAEAVAANSASLEVRPPSLRIVAGREGPTADAVLNPENMLRL